MSFVSRISNERDPIDRLPVASKTDFSNVQRKYGIVRGDWVLHKVTQESPGGHTFWNFYKPDPDNDEVYQLRHLGFTTNPKSIFCINNNSRHPIIADGDKLKEVFKSQILDLVSI